MLKTRLIKHASAIAITTFVVLAIGAVFLLKHFFHADNAQPKKMIQQITVITPPPPPPPPEPIKQPEMKEQIKEAETPTDKPQENADKSPAPEQDPNASGSGPTIAGGTGGGIGGGLGGGYEQYVRHEINEMVVDNPKLKRMDYIAMLTLQINADGEFEHCEVEIISGDAAAGDILQKLLNEKHKLSKPRPLEAASLVKLRIKSVL
jgi:protein TonB